MRRFPAICLTLAISAATVISPAANVLANDTVNAEPVTEENLSGPQDCENGEQAVTGTVYVYSDRDDAVFRLDVLHVMEDELSEWELYQSDLSPDRGILQIEVPHLDSRNHYRLTEVSAGEGCKVNPDPVYFSIDSDGFVTCFGTDSTFTEPSSDIIFFNHVTWLGDLTLYCIDHDFGNGVGGAEFRLERFSDGWETVATLVSEEEEGSVTFPLAYSDSLDGKFRITMSAPMNYLADDVTTRYFRLCGNNYFKQYADDTFTEETDLRTDWEVLEWVRTIDADYIELSESDITLKVGEKHSTAIFRPSIIQAL